MNETHVEVVTPPTTADAGVPFSGALSRFSWRATFAGVVVAVAAQILLTMLGVALGITTINASGSADVARGAGIGMGIWYLISMLLSIFAGGAVAGLTARDVSKLGGVIEGLVVWAATVVLALWVVAQGVSHILALAGGLATQAMPSLPQIAPNASQGLQEPTQNPQTMQTLRQVGNASAVGAWIAFGTLVLSAIAGIAGGMAGARWNYRRAVQGPLDDRKRRGEGRAVPTPAQPLHPSEA
jgi:hypothetical protein